MALLFAFSLQDQVEKYGAYVGLAAFLGLAVLTVLYFAQARELKRLRDWAGRAPERAVELEARVAAQADELRRAESQAEPVVERSGTDSPAQPVARPAGAPSGNGRGTGAPAIVPPGPRPAVAVAAAAEAAVAAPADTAPTDADAPAETSGDGAAAETSGDGAAAETAGAGAATEVHPAPETDGGKAPESPGEPEPPAADESPEPAAAPSGGNGVGTPPSQIPRATPRPQPRPAPAAPLRTSAPSRTATVPPRRGGVPSVRRDGEGGSRAARVTALTLAGIVLVGLVIFGATQLLGGGGEETKAPPNVAQQPSASPTGGSGAADVADQRPDTVVAVLNGTAQDGLAGSLRDQLVAEGYSDEAGMIRTGNNTDQQRQDSVVLFAPGQRKMARDVAKILGITTRPEAVDADTLALANNTGDSAAGHETDVVVVAGADQAS
jgi:hypothetical protein